MCGRFIQALKLSDMEKLLEQMELCITDPTPDYNVCPGQHIITILDDTPPKVRPTQWGFPAPQSQRPVINARFETLAQRPLFSRSFRQQRCLIPASGFYEWEQTLPPTPWLFQHPEARPFCMAGLWTQQNGQLFSTIITRPAGSVVRPIHPRQPFILQPQQYTSWLKAQPLTSQLMPFKDDELTAAPVCNTLCDTSIHSIQCIAPATRTRFIQPSLF